MFRPEDSSLDHRSLLPRRLLPAKTQISPVDKKRNRRSLELQYEPPDCPKRGLLISKTAESLTNSAETLKKVIRQDSTDSLKKGLLKSTDTLTHSVDISPKKSLTNQDPNESLKRGVSEVSTLKEDTECRKVSSSEQAKKLFFLAKTEEQCSKLGLLAPVTEESGVLGGVQPVTEQPREDKNNARSWYSGYGTLPNHTPEKASSSESEGCGSPAPRRALSLLLGSGLRGLAARRPQPVRRAASRDSALDTAYSAVPHSPGLRKCSTVLVLSSRPEPIRAFNRLRAPSVCSRCSSILSLAGGSRYSLDTAGGFVPVRQPSDPVLCKLCLEETPSDKITTIQGCGCSFCTKCMQAYVEFEVCNGAYEVSCPDAQCRLGGALSIDEIRKLVSPENVQKHLRFRLNHEVGMDQGRAFCPRVGCDTVVQVRAASPAHCPACSHDFCADCGREWHGGMSCQAAAASASASEPGALLLPDSELIKWCPMCRVPIEKDEGCAQMMCKRCKHVFCWYCLASLDDDFLLRHYDKGPCKNKLGHSRASVIWHRAQVVGIFAGFGLLLLVASPLLLLAAPCIVCCKCRLCNPNGAKNLEEVEDIEAAITEKEDEPSNEEAAQSLHLSP